MRIMQRSVKVKAIIAVFALSMVLDACGHANNLVSRITGESAETRLVFFDGGSAPNELSRQFELTDEDKSKENQLLEACKGRGKLEFGAPVAGILALTAGYALQKGISYIVDKVDEVLQDELKSYTANFTGSQTIQFYQVVDSGGPQLTYDCFRLTRRVTKGEEKRVVMDFVGKLELWNREYLVIRPLRLYYATSQAKTNGSGVIGVALSLKFDVRWRERNKGEYKPEAVDQTVLMQKVKLPEPGDKALYFYKNYLVEKESKNLEKVLQLPPWSTYDNVAYGGNVTLATVAVSEVGNPPWLLTKAAKLFSDNKDKIGSKLNEAASTVLEDVLPKGKK